MIEDSVVKEVRAARDEYARRHGYDVRAMVRDLQERERAGGRPVVRLQPRRPARPAQPPAAGSPA